MSDQSVEIRARGRRRPAATDGAAHRSWFIERLSGERHQIEIGTPNSILGSPSRTFLVNGAARQLGGPMERFPRVARFILGGTPARLTMRAIRPAFRTRLRLALGGAVSIRTLLSYLLSPGVGAGSAAASAVARQVEWFAYELEVDGSAVGTLILTMVGGVERAWTHLGPGDALPDGTNLGWPDVPAPP